MEDTQQIALHFILKLGPGGRVPVTAFRLMAGLKPFSEYISVLDLSFCKLDKLVAADQTMKVYKNRPLEGLCTGEF